MGCPGQVVADVAVARSVAQASAVAALAAVSSAAAAKSVRLAYRGWVAADAGALAVACAERGVGGALVGELGAEQAEVTQLQRTIRVDRASLPRWEQAELADAVAN